MQVPVQESASPMNGLSLAYASHSGIMARELVKDLILSFPALAPLVLVLKQFLYEKKLNEPYTGGLGSYCLVLMVACFLDASERDATEKPHASPQLPRRGMRGRSNSNPAQMAEHGAAKKNSMSQKKNWGALLTAFLDYFGNRYDYAATGLTWNLATGQGQPFSLGKYHPWPGAPFVLLDPFDQSVNIASSVFQMYRVKQQFSEALKLLQKSALNKTPTCTLLHLLIKNKF